MAEQKIEIFEDIFCIIDIMTDKNKLHKKYGFRALTLDEKPIVTSWVEAVKWGEIFNAFCRGFLIQNQIYNCENTIFSFSIGNKPPELKMEVLRYNKTVSHGFLFSKLDCLSIHSTMHKILNRCEPA
jgi:hypothetical protein